MRNPWLNLTLDGRLAKTSVQERLKLVAKFDLEKLIQVVEWSGTQQVVKVVAERQIRTIQSRMKHKIAGRFEQIRNAADGLAYPSPYE